jgi:RHS repeat-associated protein
MNMHNGETMKKGNRLTTMTRVFFHTVLCVFLMFVTWASAYAQTVATVTFYHNDGLGSPVAATNASGNVVWRKTYDPYGREVNSGGAAAASNTIGYTGHRFDEDLDLVYAGARYYDPVVGRFMSVDPVPFKESAVQSFNKYAYANNNPYGFVDPDGEDNIAVATGLRLSGANDLSNYRGQYRIYSYEVYHVPDWVPIRAQPLVGPLLGNKVGAFEISWDALNNDSSNRGSVLGRHSVIKEVSLGTGDHLVRVTDLGQTKEDKYTQVKNGMTIIRENIRMHWGGPYGSLGCGTLCSINIGLNKKKSEEFLQTNMPALNNSSTGERTFIDMPESSAY